MPLRSADAPFLPLPGRAHPDSRPVGRDVHAPVPVRPEHAGRPRGGTARPPPGAGARTGCGRPPRRSRRAGARQSIMNGLLLVRLPWCGTFKTSAGFRSSPRSASPVVSPVSSRCTEPKRTSITSESSLRTRASGPGRGRGPRIERLDAVPVEAPAARDADAAHAGRDERRLQLSPRRVPDRGGALPRRLHAERAQQERHAARVVGMGVRHHERVEAPHSRIPQHRRDAPFARVEARVARSSGVDDDCAPGGRAQQQAVALPHVDHRQVQPPVGTRGRGPEGERQVTHGDRGEAPQPLAAREPRPGPPRGARARPGTAPGRARPASQRPARGRPTSAERGQRARPLRPRPGRPPAARARARRGRRAAPPPTAAPPRC